ncbi:urease accessory protein UreE [Sedimenticola thiotaurini]|uniref:Urease accessory protein UreE n=1 Tax=Sedimenticola thiotaurini TaxID=1543721 RepID=A0A0F7JUT3_9GAMM|nr:urease accessory protein UreE [Sedimenticola thiotaurini]AKH19054.1 urease accessory protein UreE [Sedimenticola thiotaurini]
MIRLTIKTEQVDHIDTTLTLPLHQRIRSRLRVVLDNGLEAGLFLNRGTTLKDGDLLCTEEGYSVQIRAANESLSQVTSHDPHLLARACYHLGNRHVSIQIEPTCISYPHDHVLDKMLRGLGFTVTHADAPFEPEPGAYGGSAAQAHSHGHQHAHHH